MSIILLIDGENFRAKLGDVFEESKKETIKGFLTILGVQF